jgi:hypothetical protein
MEQVPMKPKPGTPESGEYESKEGCQDDVSFLCAGNTIVGMKPKYATQTCSGARAV